MVCPEGKIMATNHSIWFVLSFSVLFNVYSCFTFHPTHSPHLLWHPSSLTWPFLAQPLIIQSLCPEGKLMKTFCSKDHLISQLPILKTTSKVDYNKLLLSPSFNLHMLYHDSVFSVTHSFRRPHFHFCALEKCLLDWSLFMFEIQSESWTSTYCTLCSSDSHRRLLTHL